MSDTIAVSIPVSHAHLPQRRFEPRPFAAHRAPIADEAILTREDSQTLEQAFATGFAQGCDHAATAFAAERGQLLALVASAAAMQPESSDELAVLIVNAVTGLARSAIGQAAVESDWLVARAREAAAIIAECDAARTLWVHPDDAALLADAKLTIEVHTDADAAPGSIRVACSSGWIEHGRPLFIERIDAMRIAS